MDDSSPLSHCQPSVSAGFTRAVLVAAERLGLERSQLLGASDVQERQLADPDGRIAFRNQEALWHYIQTHLRHPEPGLALGGNLPTASFSVLNYLLQTSATLGEALDTALRYQRLGGEGGEVLMSEASDLVRISYLPLNPLVPATRARVLALMSFWVLQLRTLLPEFELAGCHFIHAEPPTLELYHERFACPLQFGGNEYSLCIPQRLLAKPLPQANPPLRNLLRQHAESLLAKLPSASVRARVTALLGSQLSRGEPGRAVLAQELGLSERTLQRRLAEEGSSYQQLLADTRRQLAERYLEQGQLPATDIALLLGYSEPSVFFRAFRHWTGQTPGEYRNSAAKGRAPTVD